MSGETERNVSGWTVDTLREHFDALNDESRQAFESADKAIIEAFKTADAAAELRNEQRFTAQQQAVKDALIAQEKAVSAALVAAEKAVLVAETNAEKWRLAANEWRGAMNDRERTLMPRSEAEQRLQAISESNAQGLKASAEKIDALAAAVEKSAGRREGLMIVFAVIAAIATIISVVMAIRGR